MAIGKFTIISPSGRKIEIDEIKLVSSIDIINGRNSVLGKYWIELYKTIEPAQQYFVTNED